MTCDPDDPPCWTCWSIECLTDGRVTTCRFCVAERSAAYEPATDPESPRAPRRRRAYAPKGGSMPKLSRAPQCRFKPKQDPAPAAPP